MKDFRQYRTKVTRFASKMINAKAVVQVTNSAVSTALNGARIALQRNKNEPRLSRKLKDLCSCALLEYEPNGRSSWIDGWRMHRIVGGVAPDILHHLGVTTPVQRAYVRLWCTNVSQT